MTDGESDINNSSESTTKQMRLFRTLEGQWTNVCRRQMIELIPTWLWIIKLEFFHLFVIGRDGHGLQVQQNERKANIRTTKLNANSIKAHTVRFLTKLVTDQSLVVDDTKIEILHFWWCCCCLTPESSSPFSNCNCQPWGLAGYCCGINSRFLALFTTTAPFGVAPRKYIPQEPLHRQSGQRTMKWPFKRKKKQNAAEKAFDVSPPRHSPQFVPRVSDPRWLAHLIALVPNQVWERIFQFVCAHAADDTYESNEQSAQDDSCMLCDLRDLAHCAQVSRRWNTLATNVM